MLFGLFNNKNKKPRSGKNNKSLNNSKNNVFHSTNKPADAKKPDLKIFKPRADFNLNQNLKPTKTQVNFNFLNLKDFKIDLNLKEWQKKLNYLVFKYNLGNKINWLIGRLIIGAICVILLYLTFFDTFFLVKNYSFSFTQQDYQIQTENGPKTINSKSYLSQTELQNITKAIDNNRFLGIIPNNQYWYLNNRNLLASSQEITPEITDLKITDRNWPNGVELQLTTEPILATLGLNENGVKKYYRVSQLGRVITEDMDNIKEKLISVDRRVSFNQSNVTFKDYPLSENKLQLNRIWFTITLWQLLDLYNIKLISTNFPSMTDTEVIVTTATGTKMFFESEIELMPREIQENRIKSIFSSNILNSEKLGQIAYLDFRTQNKKVFLCYRGKSCDK